MEEHMKWHDARIKHLEEKFNSLFCKVFGLNQRRLFIIKRLWIDSMENRDAYGYEEIGFVQTNDEADRICGLEYIPKSKYPWPLDYAYEFKGDNVPRFIAKEITDISGMGIDQLKAL
jgi:capsid portal protein